MISFYQPHTHCVIQRETEQDCVRLATQSSSDSHSPPHTHTLFASRESDRDWQTLNAPCGAQLGLAGSHV
jgi:hypothetical protein